jgi:hypothetical protein
MGALKANKSILKPLIKLLDRFTTDNVSYGVVSEILKDNSDELIGYKVKVGSKSINIYDPTKSAQVNDLVVLSVANKENPKLNSIISVIKNRVEITTVNAGINDG